MNYNAGVFVKEEEAYIALSDVFLMEFRCDFSSVRLERSKCHFNKHHASGG